MNTSICVAYFLRVYVRILTQTHTHVIRCMSLDLYEIAWVTFSSGVFGNVVSSSLRLTAREMFDSSSVSWPFSAFLRLFLAVSKSDLANPVECFIIAPLEHVER